MSLIRQTKIQDGVNASRLATVNSIGELSVNDLGLATIGSNSLTKLTDIETAISTINSNIATIASNQNLDPWMEHAKQIILADYGDTVSLEAKNKDLLKFGRNRSVGTSYATLWTAPVADETYLSANSITSIISTAADTVEVVIEGHTISGSDFTFVSQTKTLTGTTVALLDTPLARCTRIYNNNSTSLTGTISVCENDTYTTPGIPDTPAGVHCQIFAGKNQSEKASTTISSVDYWVITQFYADMLTKAAAFSEIELEVRLSGKVFREFAAVSCSDSHRGVFECKPYLIVPPNSDVRLRAISDSAGGRDISGGIIGTLLKV